MTAYVEAVRIILEHTHPLETEEKALFDSVGQVLAEDVFSDSDIPQTNRAVFDGYALRATDIETASRANPVALRIVGAIRAGFMPTRTVTAGTALRIMTGSVLPQGADCVIRFEDTDEPLEKSGPNPASPKMVRVFVAEKTGTNIGPAGFSARKGALVVPKGSLIGPAQISALTTLGERRVKVIRRPTVAIAATGDELVSPGRPLSPAQVYNSNAGAIAALVAHFGAIPKILGVARDREASLAAKLRRGLNADAVITTGGVSKGDYDIVRLSLGRLGEMLFSGIAMGPGASVAFGVADASPGSGPSVRKPVFALSGPPSGALINCETLVRPSLLRMRGLRDVTHPVIEAESTDSMPRKTPKAFVRWTRLAKVNGSYRVTLNPPEGMGPLASMASANSLTIIPEGTVVKAGDRVEVLPLDWTGA